MQNFMQMMTPKEASEFMRGAFTVTTLLHYASKKKVPSVKVGGKHWFFAHELELWRDMGSNSEAAKEITFAREQRARKELKSRQ